MNKFDKETIKIDVCLRSEYVNNPPHAVVQIDDIVKFSGFINDKFIVSFKETLYFGFHKLSVIRSNTESNQRLYIDKIIIDGVDIRDIVWIKSCNIPIYPEPWATVYRKAGHTLEEKILGETCLGHNSTWYLDFYSPSYKFVMDWMKEK